MSKRKADERSSSIDDAGGAVGIPVGADNAAANLISALKIKPADIKNMVKGEPLGTDINGDASLMMAVATELFVSKLAEEAWRQTTLDDVNRAEVTYNDLVNARSGNKDLDFLEESLP